MQLGKPNPGVEELPVVGVFRCSVRAGVEHFVQFVGVASELFGAGTVLIGGHAVHGSSSTQYMLSASAGVSDRSETTTACRSVPVLASGGCRWLLA